MAAHNEQLGEMIGMVLRVWRHRAGFTQSDMAKYLKMHRPIIARLEAGRHTQNIETIFAWARVTQADVTQAFAAADAYYGFVEKNNGDPLDQKSP
jgi:transcriptional regulator with XRE-family HTH domain